MLFRSALHTATMNACVLSVLCLLGALAVLVEGVTVQDGDLSFPLESVKKLKGLREVQEPRLVSHKKFAPRLLQPVAPQLCSSHSALPEALRPVCEKPNAEEILQRLEAIAQDPNTCEICAYAACTGC